MDETPIIKRVLPNSIEAEQSVIGSMLMDKDAILAATEILTADDFYNKKYATLFTVILELYNEGKPIDQITLQDRLKQKDAPPELYSIEFIREMFNAVPSIVNIRQYAEIVSQKSILRQMIKINEEIENNCYSGTEKLESIMELAEKKIFEITQKRSVGEFVSIKQVVLNALDKIEAASQTKGNVTGIATGYYDHDYKTSGFQPSDFILIGARPSMGKTALVLNLADHIAIRNKVPTVIFSLEMSKEQLVNRMLAMEARVDAQAIRSGDLNDSDWEKLVESANDIGKSGLIIDDTPGISIGELRSKCRKYKMEYDLQLVIIDYLQLMTGDGKTDSRQQEVSEISRSLKALARELHAPVIALSQVNRACETRPDHRPIMSDLRESGSIEQDADVIMFLYRDEYYNKDSEDNKGKAELIIAKQRNGPIGTVDLLWLPNYTRFVNPERRDNKN
ncbi:MAG: replicative DNA helicase [Lachnospiraceae bacterium]|nr:replicative DNA helicase [Lachnospiraceae bacterium]